GSPRCWWIRALVARQVCRNQLFSSRGLSASSALSSKSSASSYRSLSMQDATSRSHGSKSANRVSLGITSHFPSQSVVVGTLKNAKNLPHSLPQVLQLFLLAPVSVSC